jgi:RNA-binding protein
VYWLKRLGKILHLSNSKKLILKTKAPVRLGTTVLTAKRKPVGRVFDIFGPIKNPYIAIEPSVNDPDRYVDRVLYIHT